MFPLLGQAYELKEDFLISLISMRLGQSTKPKNFIKTGYKMYLKH